MNVLPSTDYYLAWSNYVKGLISTMERLYLDDNLPIDPECLRITQLLVPFRPSLLLMKYINRKITRCEMRCERSVGERFGREYKRSKNRVTLEYYSECANYLATAIVHVANEWKDDDELDAFWDDLTALQHVGAMWDLVTDEGVESYASFFKGVVKTLKDQAWKFYKKWCHWRWFYLIKDANNWSSELKIVWGQQYDDLCALYEKERRHFINLWDKKLGDDYVGVFMEDLVPCIGRMEKNLDDIRRITHTKMELPIWDIRDLD